MNERHTELDSWHADDFPFDPDDADEMDRIHEVLPDGHWLCRDLSMNDGGNAIALMRWDEHVPEVLEDVE